MSAATCQSKQCGFIEYINRVLALPPALIGDRFRSAFPRAWSVLEDDVRRCLLHRFPYGVLYSIEPDGVHLLAVMHWHREPDYWLSN